MAFIFLYNCSEVEGGLPSSLQMEMAGLIVLDLFLGFVPIIGDFADAWFKVNKMNLSLLESHLGVSSDAEKGVRQGNEPGRSVKSLRQQLVATFLCKG